MAKTPTPEQCDIVSYAGNRIVIANPGSGKTFTLSLIVKNVLLDLEEYQGVVAISYTNKASKELVDRCLDQGHSKKKSFFGTLDKFYISEVLIPFLPKVFGQPSCEIEIVSIGEIEDHDISSLKKCIDSSAHDVDLAKYQQLLEQLFVNEGKIAIQTVGWLANYVFDQCSSCRKYLKARYTHVIVDEYQDCGFYQHLIFKKLVRLGLVGVAVGDINQSIYGFAGKSSKYLLSLGEEGEFQVFTLTRNMRCHPSIVNYSLRLLSPDFDLLDSSELRMYYRRVVGRPHEMLAWIESKTEAIKDRFKIEKNSEIAYLVRANHMLEFLKTHSSVPIKVRFNTNLDNDSSPESQLFRSILESIFGGGESKFELISEYFNGMKKADIKSVSKKYELLKRASENPSKIQDKIGIFVDIVEKLRGKSVDPRSVNLLGEVLKDNELLDSYMPANDNQIQALTIHKAKGLEFDLVFHWDLYNWIIPNYEAMRGDKAEELQYLNLHYVGITRAKKVCFLVNSTERINGAGEKKNGESSYFLNRKGLSELRDSKVVKIEK